MQGFIHALFGFFFAVLLMDFLPTDGTDKGPFNRSEMTVRIDAATGLEYLESGRGYLTPRIGPDGRQVREELP